MKNYFFDVLGSYNPLLPADGISFFATCKRTYVSAVRLFGKTQERKSIVDIFKYVTFTVWTAVVIAFGFATYGELQTLLMNASLEAQITLVVVGLCIAMGLPPFTHKLFAGLARKAYKNEDQMHQIHQMRHLGAFCLMITEKLAFIPLIWAIMIALGLIKTLIVT